MTNVWSSFGRRWVSLPYGIFERNPLLQGGGIQFPATAVPSSDVNTLDDYEEGSFTPVLTFATPGDLSVAYSTQVGFYIKIGKQVTAAVSLVTSTFTHTTASGEVRVTGLPFTVLNNAQSQRSGGVQWQGITKANYTDMVPAAEANGTRCTIRASGSGQTIATISASDMPTAGSVVLRFTSLYVADT